MDGIAGARDRHDERPLRQEPREGELRRRRVLTTDPAMNACLARAGAGVTMIREDRVRDDLASGALVKVLEEFCTPFPGYYLHYPPRRHASPALRALVDYLREARRSPSRQKAVAGGGGTPAHAARGGRDGSKS